MALGHVRHVGFSAVACDAAVFVLVLTQLACGPTSSSVEPAVPVVAPAPEERLEFGDATLARLRAQFAETRASLSRQLAEEQAGLARDIGGLPPPPFTPGNDKYRYSSFRALVERHQTRISTLAAGFSLADQPFSPVSIPPASNRWPDGIFRVDAQPALDQLRALIDSLLEDLQKQPEMTTFWIESTPAQARFALSPLLYADDQIAGVTARQLTNVYRGKYRLQFVGTACSHEFNTIDRPFEFIRCEVQRCGCSEEGRP